MSIHPTSFIFTSAGIHEYSFPMFLAVGPISIILSAVFVLLNSMPGLQSVHPVPVINASVGISQDASTTFEIVDKISLVFSTLPIKFFASAVLDPVDPKPFVAIHLVCEKSPAVLFVEKPATLVGSQLGLREFASPVAAPLCYPFTDIVPSVRCNFGLCRIVCSLPLSVSIIVYFTFVPSDTLRDANPRKPISIAFPKKSSIQYLLEIGGGLGRHIAYESNYKPKHKDLHCRQVSIAATPTRGSV